MEVVILPPNDSVSKLLMKMLSINVALEDVTLVGCNISGRNPNEDKKLKKFSISKSESVLSKSALKSPMRIQYLLFSLSQILMISFSKKFFINLSNLQWCRYMQPIITFLDESDLISIKVDSAIPLSDMVYSDFSHALSNLVHTKKYLQRKY